MAKDNEKKVAGEMNDDELENVAGGWCSVFSTTKPKLQENQTVEETKNGYIITTKYGNGSIGKAAYDKKGNFLEGSVTQSSYPRNW